MKKLIITDTINFTDDVKNIFDVKLWANAKHGIYEVTVLRNDTKRDRLLLFWGIDNNIDSKIPLVFCMPFPVESIEKEESRIIEKEPMKLVQFDGNTITGDVLLKAIAIAQNPELAKDLL